MGNIIVMTPGELELRIRRDQKGAPQYILKAIEASAIRAQKYLIKKTPLYKGLMRLAWRVERISKSEVKLVNDQPYAGVIENGAAPFRISQKGREAIKEWVIFQIHKGNFPVRPQRNSKGQFVKPKTSQTIDQRAESISWAIAKTFEKQGIKGRKLVANNFDRIIGMINKEIEKSLDEYFSRKR
jgi:hypothetical protein